MRVAEHNDSIASALARSAAPPSARWLLLPPTHPSLRGCGGRMEHKLVGHNTCLDTCPDEHAHRDNMADPDGRAGCGVQEMGGATPLPGSLADQSSHAMVPSSAMSSTAMASRSALLPPLPPLHSRPVPPLFCRRLAPIASRGTFSPVQEGSLCVCAHGPFHAAGAQLSACSQTCSQTCSQRV